MRTFGVGIIGCGNISTAYLTFAPLFKRLEIRAVADIVADAAEARAAEFGVAARSIDELLGSDDIDIVINLTIPEAHYRVTRNILEAGKHAYTEKPLVLDLDDGKALAELAAAKDLRIGAAPDTFLGGAHQQARALIDAGGLGQITSGTAHIMSHGAEGWHPNPDFFYLPGGGPMLDMGPYYITNLVHLLGPVARVTALTSQATDTRTIGSEPRRGEVIPVETPTNIHALLQFASGATVTLTTSWDVWAHRHSNMELYGTEGALIVPDPNIFNGTVEQAGREGGFAPVAPWDHPLGRPNQEDRANYRTAGLADMARAIDEGGPHRCSFELALHVTDVMTSILRAGEAQSFVEMTTTCARPAALGPEAAQSLLA